MATRQIRRLLIANRGEIAIRIARTARDRGISCVGVYSDADSTSLHLDSMDVAVALGGETAAESYLRIDAIVDAAVANGCDAVHPGYGFLAENAEAARAVEAAGLMWVGPTAEQIELLGDKVAAKRAAEEAGVPTTPIIEVAADGSTPADVSMPALVKAAAGGGGRGMRIVREGDDLAAAIESASREAAAAFGDATVFIEPYIEQGRHIEVQIVGDGEGEVLHFGERDCSVQRRNQKVIEEAPAVGLPDDVRAALHDGATRLARHVNYRGAGTVEFLVGHDGTITFLEVNTRLQVEHPVTEAVTGVDLVGLQFDVASGAGLGMTQDAISLCGHAVELRLVAEDPSSGWMPSTGVITAFDVPGNVRVDSGIRPGSVVTTNYDSLLAKIIVTGADRQTALAVAADAMRRADIGGVRTNADSLVAILTDDVFAKGGVDTGYLDRQPHVLQGVRPETADIDAHLVAVVLDRVAANRRADQRWGFAPSGWRNLSTRGQRITMVESGGDAPVEYEVEYRLLGGDTWEFLLGPWPKADDDGALDLDDRPRSVVRRCGDAIEIDGRRTSPNVSRLGESWRVSGWSGRTEWHELPRFAEHDADLAGSGPVAPLPGTVIDVRVSDGDSVEADQVLMVIEAMKMEHQITTPSAATVTTVCFSVGDRVDMGDLLVELEIGGQDS